MSNGYFPDYRLQQPAAPPQYNPTGDVLGAGGDTLGEASKIPGPQQPYLATASALTSIVGTGFDIYGKYQQRQQAQQQYQDAVREWERQRIIEEEDRQREIMRQQRQEAYFGGQYSQGLEDRFAGAYGGYRQGGQ